MRQALTTRTGLHPWLFALCLATFFTPAWALKRVALVIGNSEYVVESRLANPVNDAQLMARTLKAQGFTVDVKTDLPKRAMELAIATFIRQSAGADSAVLYYAGHGSQPANGGRNFLLPVDARVEGDDTLETDGIAADRIVEQMERSANPAKLRLVVLDACRNNRLGGKTRSGIRGLARMSPSDDYTLIAFSTNDQDVAQDGSGANSPYAKALSQHLGQASELPLRRIFELTATDVRAATGQKQKPRTYGDLDSRILLDGTLMASIKPEPVAATPQPGQTAGLSLDDLEKEDATRKQWTQWQARMKADFDKTTDFGGSADLQVKAWERFLAAWAQDNPLSREDEAMRSQASTRREQAQGLAVTVMPSAPQAIPSAQAVISSSSDSKGWIWPANGPVLAGFDVLKNKGLDIGGSAGEPIRAVADGRVTYSGDGLRGYGKLIILKHDNTYMTAYAHNRVLLVTENQVVKKGQQIAEMGSSEAERVKLHFEVRKRGKPVDPAPYLPGK